jgi:hypothetical protein
MDASKAKKEASENKKAKKAVLQRNYHVGYPIP